MLDHFIRSYAANEQVMNEVIHLRLRRRPPTGSFEDKNDPTNPVEDAFSGMDGGDGKTLLFCSDCSFSLPNGHNDDNDDNNQPPRLLLVLLDLDRDLHLDLRDLDLE